MIIVMLVDIPDPTMILGIIASFFVGLFAIVVYNRVKPRFGTGENDTKIILSKLQYYENLLIDMKIRLDSLELDKEDEEVVRAQVTRPKDQKLHLEKPEETKEEKPRERMHNMNFGNATEHVLGLITEKPMTSRDIQITIGRTREHTSRMMKKLFDEGLVERDMHTKPFTYKITDKGLARIGVLKTQVHSSPSS